jgi:hypothetical protein
MENDVNYHLLLTGNTPEDLEAISQGLSEKSIPYKVEKEPVGFDPTFAFRTQVGGIQVWVDEMRLDEARRVMQKLGMLVEAKEDESSDFFAEFTNEELQEVLVKPEEWGVDQVVLARQTLLDRGEEIDAPKLKADRKAHLNEVRKPKKVNPIVFVVVVISMIPGGFLGLIVAFWLALATNKDPDGKRYFAYTQNSRRIAAIIAGLGIGWSLLFYYSAATGNQILTYFFSDLFNF